MRVVRMFAALITVAGVALAGGCGSGGTSGIVAAGPASAPADPREQLVAGVRALNSATFRMVESTMVNTVRSRTEGVYDPARRAARIKLTHSVAGKVTATDSVVLDHDAYVRFEQSPFPGIPAGTWMHIDVRRAKSSQAFRVDGDDMTGKLALVGAIVTVERTGRYAIRGTYDISKAASVMPRATDVLGNEARNAPWQARFDERNRLVWMFVNLPRGDGLPDVTTESTYSGFGEPVTIDGPPTGSTVEAPERLYTVIDR